MACAVSNGLNKRTIPAIITKTDIAKAKNGILAIFLKEYKFINNNAPKIKRTIPKRITKMLTMGPGKKTNNSPKARFIADCINKTFFSFLISLLIAKIINKIAPISSIIPITIIIVCKVNLGKKMANRPMTKATIPLINELCGVKNLFSIMFFYKFIKIFYLMLIF